MHAAAFAAGGAQMTGAKDVRTDLEAQETGVDSDTQGVQKCPATVLRGRRVDGARIKGTGLWGYVHDSQRVVIFVDCLKPAANGTPWYQIRGIY